MSKYVSELLRIARDEMPSLQYDIENASTQFTLQSACQRMHNIVAYLVHDRLLDAEAAKDPNLIAAAAQPAPVAAPAPVVAAPYIPGAGFTLPLVTQPGLRSPAAVPGMPELTIEPGATNVIVTPQGTKVLGGPQPTIHPPLTPVNLAPVSLAPPPLGETDENGIPNVVVPAGGAVTPEVAAALATRP